MPSRPLLEYQEEGSKNTRGEGRPSVAWVEALAASGLNHFAHSRDKQPKRRTT
jgi:hypothetical protein